MELIRDFREFIESLNKNEVEYIVVGGYAVILYGYPRLTIDIDFWVNPTANNSTKVIKSINDFGFDFVNLTPADFEKSDNVIQLGRPPYRIDILTTVEGLEFDDCYKRKFVFNSNNLTINFISRNDLLENKKAVGRYKDLDDISKLIK